MASPGGHAHIIWQNSSDDSSNQSTTPHILQQMWFLPPGTDPRGPYSQTVGFSQYMFAQNSSSSSGNSTALQQQLQHQQRLHDFHVNFTSNGEPASHGQQAIPQTGLQNMVNAAYPAMEAQARRNMEGSNGSYWPSHQPAQPQVQMTSASADGHSQQVPSDSSDTGKKPYPSKGSAGHDRGNCRPCHYFHSRTGCANGEQCNFCHLKHAKRSKVRIPKQYRQQCRALAQLVFDTQGSEEEIRREMELQLLVQTSFDHRLTAYATSVLKSLRGGAVLQDFPQGLAQVDGQDDS